MSRKKGMSHDDKMTAMQSLMMESKDVWTLKDLEKDCPKKKGIIAQSVKDVLQELCDNDMVSFEKIGSGNFYWCFPSEALNRRKVAEAKLQKETQDLEAEAKALQDEIAALEPGREDSDERTQLNKEIQVFEGQLAEIHRQTAKYDQMNPEAIKKMKAQTIRAFDAANRWTDNIFTAKSYCSKTFNIEPSVFDTNFGIEEGFDYFQ